MPDSSDLDLALVTKLSSDATLTTLMPDGVWIDEAPAGSDQFVIVSLIDENDVQQLGGRSFEDALYLVEARELSKVAVKNIKAAAARIDALLENGTLTVAGYSVMAIYRMERVRLTEVDELDESIRWARRGGRYRLVASTT
jgi:hypothetical protein